MHGIKDIRKKIGVTALAACMSIAFLFGCSAENNEKKNADFSGVRSVCELTTLEAYYHNVAKTDVDASGPFAALLNTGHKRVWIEYTGTVYYGIDADQVTIKDPNERGEVEIHMPDVKILDTYLDKDSIGTVVETGFLTNVTAEEKAAGIAAAQDDMVKSAEQNQSLRTQAYDKAQRTLAAYVKNVGAAIGETYTVKWV